MADVLRLTYRELANRLGLTPDGVRFLARRRMWPIENGNDSRKMVILTQVELAAEVQRVTDDQGINGRSSTDDRGMNGASESAYSILLDNLRECLGKAEGEATQLREQNARLHQQVSDLQSERDRIVEQRAQARERAAKAEGEASTLRDALFDLSARLDRAEARLAMPWWKRLFG
jgi:hypothetical protein